MNVNKTYKQFLSFLSDFATRYAFRQFSLSLLKSTQSNYKQWNTLSKAQKKQISDFWSIKHPINSDFVTHEIMLNVKGKFDVKYCPESVFRLKFDDDNFYRPWTDKNYYERFMPNLPLAHTHVRNVNGCFLDYNYNPITKEEAKKIIMEHLPLIIKPSILSGQGKNIKLISNENEVDDIFIQYDKNYLLQELIIQCDELSKISPHSVASIRLITAIVNNKPVLLKKQLLGNITDSIAVNSGEASGSGVVIIKIDDDGKLDNLGYFEDARSFNTLPNGFDFGELQIPAFQDAVNLVLEAHKNVPMLNFIGWDITIDKDNKPVIIEWNLRHLEIFHSQLTQGPLFGEYSNYYADKLKNKKPCVTE